MKWSNSNKIKLNYEKILERIFKCLINKFVNIKSSKIFYLYLKRFISTLSQMFLNSKLVLDQKLQNLL